MDGNADLYEILQVSPNAESEVIEAAYRRLARKYHPDAGLDASQDRMAEINGAYETLSDRAKRAAYDRRRAANRATPSAVRANRGPRRPVATAETAPPARSAPVAPTAPAVNVSRITIACRRCRGAAFRQGKPIGWPRGENFRQGSTLRCTDCGRHWRYAWTIDHPNVLDPEHERYSPKAGGVIRPSRNLLRFTAAVIFLFALAIVAAIVLFPDPTVRLIGDLQRFVVDVVQRVKS